MKQAELIYNYNEAHRDKFNPQLFYRSDEDIIKELKNIILSCQRSKFFTIQVVSFTVVEDYQEINDTLFNYEESLNKNKDGKSKEKKKDNPYGFINLKDSDIKLLIVRYFLKIGDAQEYVNVYIAVPRIVDKYYFRIGGNVYSAMYQIVDASTYNNSTSNSKKHSVTLKTMFMPIRVYRSYIEKLKTTNKDTVKCTCYRLNVFNKSVPLIKYMLAKFGFYEGLRRLNMNSAVFLSQHDPEDENMYTFHVSDNITTFRVKNDNAIYVNTPKYLFDNDAVVQSTVFTLLECIGRNTEYDELFLTDFWVVSLGSHFSKKGTPDTGLSILDSLEYIYDISTRESIHLPYEYKKDVYCILRWMMCEFNELKIKSNLDISTKRIRCAEYIASLYAMRLATGIYRLSELKSNPPKGSSKPKLDKNKQPISPDQAKLNNIKKAIVTQPNCLTVAITKCQLVNYRNMVNDTDSLTASKFTYKGISGIGEKGSNSVPSIYRSVHISQLGRVDLDSSSATDPGITGTLCPLGKLYDGMSFSEFSEPNSWDEGFGKILSTYKALVGLKEATYFRKQLGMDIISPEEECAIDDSITSVKALINPIKRAESDIVVNKIDLEEGGVIYYE